MNEITGRQTDIISQFVKRQEIVFSHLCDDLIDHICCEIEDEMKAEAGFDEAFRRVRLRIGENGLREIQEETLYAVDSKYRKMKKAMKISSVAGTIMVGLASVLKILHMPMAGVLLTLGAFMIIFIFLPSSLTVLWKESKSSRRVFLFISAFLASALYIAGIIFRIQHWPGAPVLISAGILSAVFLFVPAGVHSMLRNHARIVPAWIIIWGGISASIFGAGYLLKIMHWPGASVFILLGISLFAILVIPSFIWHHGKREASVSARAITIITATVLFFVPSALINFDTIHNFEKMFLSTTELGNRSLEFRLSRNDVLWSEAEAEAAESEDLTLLHSETQTLMDLINTIEENGFDTSASLITELENKLGSFSSLLVKLNGDFRGKVLASALEIERYLPPLPFGDEMQPRSRPEAVIQSLNLLKGSLLDAEAATIRNLAGNAQQNSF
ncbi:MAG: hypothetical protein LC649_06240 [Bacteroidales bacterium]|nr:hypothetical protein [Bacteroidales bacterium]